MNKLAGAKHMRYLAILSIFGLAAWFSSSRPWRQEGGQTPLQLGLNIDVKTIGAAGDGVTDDTGAIQSAIGKATEGSVIVIPAGRYLITGLEISKKSRLKISGGGTLVLRSLPGKNGTFAFKLSGLCSHLEIDGLSIIGDGKAASHQTGIGSFSGQDISDVSFHNLNLEDLAVGISLNADLSGSYKRATIKDNRLSNIVGTEPGTGYGIHVANAEHSIIQGNILIRTQRHAIYHARGAYNSICFNHVIQHRAGVSENALRSAIVVARDSIGINVIGNTIESGFDGGISLEGTTEGPLTVRECNVSQNVVLNPKNAVPLIFCGEQVQQKAITLENISISNNVLDIDASEVFGIPLINCYFGHAIKISNNSIRIHNANGNRVVAIQIGNGDFVNSPDFLQDFDVSGNLIYIGGIDASNHIAIRLDSFICHTEGVRCRVKGNCFANLRGQRDFNYKPVVCQSAPTNHSLEWTDYLIQGRGTAPPKAGFWTIGDTITNENPAPGTNCGWICTKAGVPGVWSTLPSLPEK